MEILVRTRVIHAYAVESVQHTWFSQGEGEGGGRVHFSEFLYPNPDPISDQLLLFYAIFRYPFSDQSPVVQRLDSFISG